MLGQLMGTVIATFDVTDNTSEARSIDSRADNTDRIGGVEDPPQPGNRHSCDARSVWGLRHGFCDPLVATSPAASANAGTDGTSETPAGQIPVGEGVRRIPGE